jgi:hypothetical protein
LFCESQHHFDFDTRVSFFISLDAKTLEDKIGHSLPNLIC